MGGMILSPDHKAIGGARSQSNDGPDAHKYLWAGTILHVDVETMVCSVRLDSGEGERHDIPLPSSGGGPRSWSGSIPEPGSKVLLHWKKYSQRAFKPYIVQFLTTGVYTAREFEPFSSVDPSDLEEVLTDSPELGDIAGVNLDVIRLKLRKAYPGDYLASSSSGSDVLLDRDAHLTNRAGNEFRLRDSDQTSVLQVLNEFTSNAAGYYRRGLIKRNAYNILPDVFGVTDDPEIIASQTLEFDANDRLDSFGIGVNRKISKESPAFQILLDQGLIRLDENGDGVTNFAADPNDSNWSGWPYIVTPDGQRVSYITHGDHAVGFDETDLCYVEDRRELRHCSDGIMAVTEEGDGIQIDVVNPVFIEDVCGTVVGNDPHTDAGRLLYKQILKMRVFDSQDQAAPSAGPKFEAVDMVQSMNQADSMALARLFRIQSPTSGNQFAFGISKEGRIFLHVPKSIEGEAQDSGKSIDMNIAGLLKMIVGADPNSENCSMDIRLQGGLAIDIGRFSDGKSVHLKMAGKVKNEYSGQDSEGIALETVVGGSAMSTVGATNTRIVNGSDYELVGGSKLLEATGYSLNAGAGGIKAKSAGDYGFTVLGKSNEQYAQLCMRTNALGCLKTTVSGVDSSTVLVGSIARTVVAGAGIVDTVTTGNIASTVAAGNLALSVGAGNLTATVGAGTLNLTCGGGPVNISSGAMFNVTAPITSINSPLSKLGTAPTGGIVSGVPSVPGPHIDYVTGLPLMGSPVHLMG